MKATTTIKTKAKRAASYARYSTDLQKDRSVDDQFELLNEHAKRNGLKIVLEQCDRAKSAATLFKRPGMIELMHAATRGEFDVLLCENMDRLSRGLVELPTIFEHMKACGVEIHSLAEGVATATTATFKALMGSQYLEELGKRVRGRMTVLVREGKIPGTVFYGYTTVEGKPMERAIVPAEAAIIVRIYREFVAGSSPRAIAARLNAEGVPSPAAGMKRKDERGNKLPVSGKWTQQTLLGGGRKAGILSNTLYAGRLTWNKSRSTYTSSFMGMRKPVKKATSAAEHEVIDLPRLRIVDQELWDAAQEKRAERSAIRFPNGKVARRPFVSRKEGLLAGLLRCGVCNGPMRVATNYRVACGAAMEHGTCTHKRSYMVDKLEAAVTTGLPAVLLDPDLIAKTHHKFHDKWSARNRAMRAARDGASKRLSTVEAKIGRLLEALEDGLSDEHIGPRLQELYRERDSLRDKVRIAAAETNVVDLHPKAIDLYKANVKKLGDLLRQWPNKASALAVRIALRNVLECVVVDPVEKFTPPKVRFFGRLAAILGADLFSPQAYESADSTGTSAVYTKGNPGKPGLSLSYSVVLLGTWREQPAA